VRARAARRFDRERRAAERQRDRGPQPRTGGDGGRVPQRGPRDRAALDRRALAEGDRRGDGGLARRGGTPAPLPPERASAPAGSGMRGQSSVASFFAFGFVALWIRRFLPRVSRMATD